jgi:hypothetical protein
VLQEQLEQALVEVQLEALVEGLQPQAQEAVLAQVQVSPQEEVVVVEVLALVEEGAEAEAEV